MGHVHGMLNYDCIVIRVDLNMTHLINHDTTSLIKHVAQHDLHNLFNKHIVVSYMPSIFNTKMASQVAYKWSCTTTISPAVFKDRYNLDESWLDQKLLGCSKA
jgi:hypothetical protein